MRWSDRRWVRVLRGRRGQPLGLLLLAILLGLGLVPDVLGLGAVRLAGFDAYQRWAPRIRRSAPAVIVAIDEESLRLHGQWPWPRTWLARLVTRLAEARPAAIGIDLVMPEVDRLSPSRLPEFVPGMSPDLAQQLARLPSNDEVLAQALGRLPVVLGVAGLEADGGRPGGALRRAPLRTIGGDPRAFVSRYEGALRSVEEIDRVARGHGLLNVEPERGVVRRMPLVAGAADAVLPSFGVEMLRVATGAPLLTVRVGASGIEAVGIHDLLVPTESDGSVRVRFGRSDPSRFVSAAEVLAGTAAAHLFERKLVLIGVTALGLSDYQATPVSERMSGVEIHAQLLESILEGDLLSRPRAAAWAEAAVLVVAGLVLVLAVPRSAARTSVALFVLVIGAVWAGGFLSYLGRGILFDAALPSLALGVLFMSMLSVTLAEAESQRRILRRSIEHQREQAARVAGELEAARRIQMSSLPRPTIVFPGDTRLDLYALLEPAREVGGDLYDFFPLDQDRVFFLIGDVSGKGVPGSLFMAVSKALYKSAALRQAHRVETVMREANAEISRENTEGLFVTVLAGILDRRSGLLEYCNAGHEPPYLLPGGERPLLRLMDGGGPPLCAVDCFPYSASSRRLEPGDTLCLITDGVTEAVSPGLTRYGRGRLEALLTQAGAAANAADVGDAIRRDVARFTDGVEPSDDMAILVVRWKGPSAASGR
jgi:serine phosphatase RsbU (regulator of sigma subunit)/CHASE2 domain-containing sensor protein